MCCGKKEEKKVEAEPIAEAPKEAAPPPPEEPTPAAPPVEDANQTKSAAAKRMSMSNMTDSRIQKNTAEQEIGLQTVRNQRGGAGLAQGPAGANNSMAKSMAGAPPQSLMLQSTIGEAQKGEASQVAKVKADVSQAFKTSKSMKKK